MVSLILNLLQDELEEEESVQSLPVKSESSTEYPKDTIFGNEELDSGDEEKKRERLLKNITGRLERCQHRDVGVLVKDEKRR